MEVRLADLHKLSTSVIRDELTKRKIEFRESELRQTLAKRLKTAIESELAVQCHSGTKCESGVLCWSIEWDAVECVAARGPGNRIKSSHVTVGNYEWYAEFYPKGESAEHMDAGEGKENDGGGSGSGSGAGDGNNNNSNNNNNSDGQPSAEWPSLFVSIVETRKVVQMKFSAQIYNPRKARWDEAMQSTVRTFRRNHHGFGWKEWLYFEDLKRVYTANGAFKIKINIDVFGTVKSRIVSDDKVCFNEDDNVRMHLSDKMKALFASAKFADVRVVVCGYTAYYEQCQQLMHSQSELSDADADDDDQDLELPTSKKKRKLSMPSSSSSSPPHKRRKVSHTHSHNNNSSTRRDGQEFVTLSIATHKCILSSFSPYFERMFSHRFKESEHGRIYIGNKQQQGEEDDGSYVDYNVDPYVMRALLQYIYTEQMSDDVDRYALLLLADRYQVESLVIKCLEHLSNAMDVCNVIGVLSAASKFNEKYVCAQKTRLQCLDFICKNISAVMQSEAYKNVCKNDKTLMHEILSAFAEKHKPDDAKK